jgi:natural product precursor
MKKIKELKLNRLCKTELEKKQMTSINGGDECSCTCDSGLTYGMMGVMGYQSHKCDGAVCICQCNPTELWQAFTDSFSALPFIA